MNISRLHYKGLSFTLVLLSLPIATIQAADGDIIISRTVQPRVATRAPLAPDPNPRAVNASPTYYIGSQLGTDQINGELSDREFSQISSGRLLPASLPGMQAAGLGSSTNPTNHSALPGLNASHKGGASGGLGGQINRSVQQGLQPLHMLGGQ